MVRLRVAQEQDRRQLMANDGKAVATAVEDRVIPVAWEKLLIQGDLSHLSPDQRAKYYLKVCESLGLNHLTKPFDYIELNRKLTLYAKKDCTDQLRKIHNVSVKITDRQRVDDLYVVTANAKFPNGREDESIGAVFIGGLKGENLANAMMKAETKSKRRVTLSICGLGILDESEIEDAKHEERQAWSPPDYMPGLSRKQSYTSFVEETKSLENANQVFAGILEDYVGNDDARKKLYAAMKAQGVKWDYPPEEP